METLPLITALLAGLGIGSILTAFLQYILKQKETAFLSQRNELERRYRVIILLMYAAFDFKTNATTLHIQRPDLQNQEDVLEELKAEWFNMLLFASEETQSALHIFIETSTLENLKKTALSMRKDLRRGALGSSIMALTFT